jgi:predicted alpha/beta-fold hydrolase
MRGCGAGVELAKKPAHGGRSEDVLAAVQFIGASCPGSQLAVVGFSLGGNQVLKMLGEWGSQTPSHVVRAMAVEPPIDLMACSQNIGRPSRFVYNRSFVRSLVRDARRRQGLSPKDLCPPPRTVLEFDDRVTAPLSGFADAAEYYALSSSGSLLNSISTPTVILAARDDPLVPFHIFEDTRMASCVAFLPTCHGGHMGFFGRAEVDRDRCWLDWRVVEFACSP